MEFNNKLKIYYDSEFTGLHQDTSLISIGLKSESGSYFYAELTDYDNNNLSSWIIENVINNMIFNDKDCFISLINLDGNEYIAGNNKSEIYNVLMKDSCYFTSIKLLEWLENEYKCSGKQIQIYSDCYAYDWVLFNDLICKEGDALNIPKFINYIPIDLSTALMINDIDPDITREEYVGELLEDLYNKNPFSKWIKGSDNIKHNSLWDAYVCELCFKKIGIKDNDADNLKDIMDIEIDD